MPFGFSRRDVVRHSHQKSRRPAPKRRRLFFDYLEDRRLLSSAPVLNWDLHLNSAQETYGLASTTDTSGNIFVAGGFAGTTDFNPNGLPVNVTPAVTLAGSDPFLAKYSPAGALEWIDEISALGAGGSEGAGSARLAIGGSGDVYLATGVNNTGVATGARISLQVNTYSAQNDFQTSTASFNEINHGGVLGRFDTASGTAVWLEDPALNGSIAVDQQDNVYLTRAYGGTLYVNPDPTGTQTVTSSHAMVVEKLDSAGKYLWAESIADGPSWYNDGAVAPYDIAVDSSGSIYLTGDFYGTRNFYPQFAGQPLQGTYDLTSSIIPKSKSGYSAFQTFSMFVEKLDTNGNFVYAHGTGGAGAAYGQAIAVDAAGEVYVGALYNGTVDFGMGSGTHSLASSEGTKTQLSGPFDTAILKLDSSGKFAWIDNFATKSDELTVVSGLDGIAVDTSSNLYVYGQFNGTADFDPGSGVTDFTSSADNGYYLMKLSPSGGLSWAAQTGGNEQYATRKMLAVDAAGNIDRAGWLAAPINLGPAPGADVTPNAQDGDAFLAQWSQPVSEVNGATHFSVIAAANATAGAPFNITVTALDANGNTASGYNGTVNLTSSDGQAVLPIGAMLTNGVGTFTVTLKTAGSQTITATDSGNNSLIGANGAVTVTAGAAAQLVFTSAPFSVTSGQNFKVTIEVTDAYGNMVTGYLGTIHFSLMGGSGTLPADYTFTAADEGVHTFTGLKLTQSGRKQQVDTLTVSDVNNSSVSGSVVVKV